MPEAAKPGAHREAALNYCARRGRRRRGAAGRAPRTRPRRLRRARAAALAALGLLADLLQELDLEALAPRTHEPDPALPAILGGRATPACSCSATPPSCTRARRRARAARRDPLLARAGRRRAHRALRALLHAPARAGPHKLEAASAAFWTGGAFLYVPPGLQIEEPFATVYEISGAGSAQYAHTLAIADRGAEIVLREYDLAGGEIAGDSLHAGQFELYLEDGARCRLAQLTDWGEPATSHDASTSIVEVGRDAYCHWLPALLGGA